MGKQVEMFPVLEDENARLNAAQAEMRRAEMERKASKVRRPIHRRSVAASCPSCGACVTIRIS